jgi:hypothetical protein
MSSPQLSSRRNRSAAPSACAAASRKSDTPSISRGSRASGTELSGSADRNGKEVGGNEGGSQLAICRIRVLPRGHKRPAQGLTGPEQARDSQAGPYKSVLATANRSV